MAAHEHHVERFLRHAGPIEWSDHEMHGRRVDPALARVLHVAALLERDTAFTVEHARSFGLQRTDDLATFLPLWDTEEREHALAFEALLAQQTYEPPPAAPATISTRRHLAASLPLGLVGRARPVGFLFCVLGAAAEYLATAVYSMLARQATDATVRRLVHEVSRQEARHFAFFLAAAERRGAAMTGVEGAIARRVLAAVWEPIGVPTLGREGWWRLFGDWVTDAHFRDRMLMVDRVIGDLPHLGGCQLMADFVAAPMAVT